MKPFSPRRFLAVVFVGALAASSPVLGQETPPASPTPHTHQIPSELLGQPKRLCVYLPPAFDASGERRYPVLYFLHGLGNNAEDFFAEGIAQITDELIRAGEVEPLIVACPSGDFSFYVNRPGGAYEDHVTAEVRAFVENLYPARADRAGRGISGISMGGYGAIKIGLRRPELYGSASGHTPFMLERLPDLKRTDARSQRLNGVFSRIFGNPIDSELWRENDPFELAQTRGLQGLALYFNSAAKDRYFLNREANAFHRLLDEKGLSHAFEPIDDVHGWVSLRNQWAAILRFHHQIFDGGGRTP